MLSKYFPQNPPKKINLLVELEESQKINKVIKTNLLSTIIVCTNFHGNYLLLKTLQSGPTSKHCHPLSNVTSIAKNNVNILMCKNKTPVTKTHLSYLRLSSAWFLQCRLPALLQLPLAGVRPNVSAKLWS